MTVYRQYDMSEMEVWNFYDSREPNGHPGIFLPRGVKMAELSELPQERRIGIPDASRLFGIPVNTLWSRVRAGRVPAYRDEDGWRVWLDSAFLEAQQAGLQPYRPRGASDAH
ncbi:MAG TPA: hypothetical protein VK196_06145 [Magnetospirillum sp.]|nr:hypothetical protein [Magnetospirillum sp.]